jgi:hypothetical protein
MVDLNYLKHRVFEINNKYPNINYGGCGTFSYHLYQVLKNKYNTIAEIVYVPSTTPPALYPNYDIKFSHILVKIGNVLIDNNGTYHINEPENIELLSIQKLKEMISIPELWNNRFDQMVYNRNFSSERITDRLVKDIYLI